ncbi:MAG TPA: hypothetical protein DCS93_17145 [Microscillaceae bacterium]|nr:hypothetical protein [Microscillaceae bacterium]
MKSLMIVFFCAVTFSLQAQSPIDGVWNTRKDNSKIEITQTGDSWTGKLKSSNNKNAKIGKVILKDLKKSGDHWVGKIYVTRRDRWFDVKVFPKSNALELKVNAGFRSRTIEWTKG